MANSARSASPAEAPNPGAASAAARRRRDLYLLSTDDGLLIEIGPVLGDAYRSRPIDSPEQLEPPAGSSWMLLVDATTRSDARALVARIEQQHPLAPIIVACADGKSADWAAQRSRGTVSAIVERSQMQGGGLAAALAQAAQVLDSTAAAVHGTGTLPSLSGVHSAPGGRKWLVAALVACACAAGGWFLMRPHGPAAPVEGGTSAPQPAHAGAPAPAAAAPAAGAAMPPATGPAVQQRPVLDLLSDARVAFRDERTALPPADSAPRGASALELYAAVLAQDPGNDEALDGLSRLLAMAKPRIAADIAAARVDDATRLLAAFHAAGLKETALAGMEQDLAAARPRMLAAQARAAMAAGDTAGAGTLITQFAAAGGDRNLAAELRHELDQRGLDAQLAGLAARARTAIAAGNLLEPQGESAQAQLAAMQQVNRTHPLAVAVQHELQLALIARAQGATRAGQFDGAKQWLASAAELGSNGELSAARRDLQSAIDANREREAAAAARAAQPQPAAVPAASGPGYLMARARSALNASYPDRALAAKVSGYVIVEFTVDDKGRASDVTVIESSPPKVFDESAVQAVRRGRFDTEGTLPPGAPRRARLRVGFRP